MNLIKKLAIPMLFFNLNLAKASSWDIDVETAKEDCPECFVQKEKFMPLEFWGQSSCDILLYLKDEIINSSISSYIDRDVSDCFSHIILPPWELEEQFKHNIYQKINLFMKKRDLDMPDFEIFDKSLKVQGVFNSSIFGGSGLVGWFAPYLKKELGQKSAFEKLLEQQGKI